MKTAIMAESSTKASCLNTVTLVIVPIYENQRTHPDLSNTKGLPCLQGLSLPSEMSLSFSPNCGLMLTGKHKDQHPI